MSKPIVAIVGRPNVGKSTLFNKISGSRISIVEDTPGVTRDRIYNDIEWNGRALTLVDTGGIEPRVDDMMLGYMREQAQTAIETADVIVFMVDVTTGVTASDRDVATMLMKSRKPLILCVNKVDSVGELPMEYYEFYELGIDGDPIPVSSVHGTGTGDLLDRIVELCPDTEAEEEDDSIKVAVIGKPNAGKSSIINKILGENRLIVSNIAGTTRDAIDTAFENEFGRYTFIDTAGIRRQSKVNDRIEKFSVLRSKAAVERADVCLILIDGTEGLTEQDERIAGLAHEAGKPSVIVVNKWDAVEKDNGTVKAFEDKIRTGLAYMSYAPIMFVSAKTGQRVGKLFELINRIYEQSCMRISTGMLNDVLSDAVMRVQPPTDKGRRLKIYYITQTSVKPPVFVIFCNDAELFHFSYQRYIENQIREVFGFYGTPIVITVRQRGENG
ncbi:MAG: ribosome biogenesis GTPase Der [Christensenellales bacterium]|jgi:GTP-binding protein|nr:MAG: ribosome biogenesis GTPase Der [Oscillospiraceae bacterium]